MGMAEVVLLGFSIVVVCLIVLIFICKIMSAIIMGSKGNAPVATPAVQTPAPQVVNTAPSVDKQQLIAAIGVAIAEEMGTDISRIKIHSIKKV